MGSPDVLEHGGEVGQRRGEGRAERGRVGGGQREKGGRDAA